MWYQDFADRLESWSELRKSTVDQPIDVALATIDDWWINTPWQAYYLHWDDIGTWPDPWQLLSDNIYCDLARGLGIMYTVCMLNRPDVESVELVLTKDDYNLVLVNNGKYILNWGKSSCVNTDSVVNVKKKLTKQQIEAQLK